MENNHRETANAHELSLATLAEIMLSAAEKSRVSNGGNIQPGGEPAQMNKRKKNNNSEEA